MRPTVFLPSAVVALLAAAPAVSAAQVSVFSTGPGGRVYSTRDDRDRPALGVTLGASRGRADTLGVRITDVNPDGPAAKAGIEEGDRITAIDGTSLKLDPADADDPMFDDLSSRRLSRALEKHKPGDEVTLGVMRGREARTVRVKTVAATELRDRTGSWTTFPGGMVIGRGTSARDIEDSVRARAERRAALGLSIGVTGTKRDTLGLFVSRVSTDGPAEKAGIVEGARVASIDNVDLRLSREDADDPELAALRARRFSRELEKKKPGDAVSLRVWQNGAYRTMNVTAVKATDLFKGRSFSYSFGDGGDGMFVMPPMPAMPPMPSTAPLARSMRPRALPRTFNMMSAPRAVAVPRLRRTVEM